MSKTQKLPTTLGGRFHAAREAKGLPLRVVAESVGMDLTLLQRVESGSRVPTEKQTRRLAGFYGFPESELLALRIAEKFLTDYSGDSITIDAIAIIAEQTGVYEVRRRRTPGQTTTKGARRADA